MKKSVLLLVFMVLLCINYFSQPATKKHNSEENVILNDTFSNNNNGWFIGENEYARIKMENNALVFSSIKENSSYANQISFPIDQSENFSIETTVENVSGEDQNGYGLIWGLKDYDNFFMMTITNSQWIKIAKFENGKQVNIKDWYRNVYINYGTPNKLKITKDGEMLKFFVNDIHTAEIPYQKFFGDKLGFIVYNQKTVKFDYLKVTGTKGALASSDPFDSDFDFTDVVFNKKGDKYREQFQKAFRKIVEDVDNDFKNAYDKSDRIEIGALITNGKKVVEGTFYPQMIVPFPEADHCIYKINEIYLVDFDRRKAALSMAAYYNVTKNKSGFYWDEEISNRVFNKLANELKACKNLKIGGEWEIETGDTPEFIMRNKNNPDLSVSITTSGTTGLEMVIAVKRTFGTFEELE